MKNIIISTVAAVAVLAFAGCAPKKSCGTTPKVVKPAVVKPAAVAPKPAPVVATPAPVVTPEPVVIEAEPVVAPMMDAKESAVQ
jgi:hypothetical protein